MEHLILPICLFIAFMIAAGFHLYVMKKISDVQDTILRSSKEWRDLDNCLMACVYTLLMLFFFSVIIGLILHKFVMFEMFLRSVVN